jgi:hypothetical protein
MRNAKNTKRRAVTLGVSLAVVAALCPVRTAAQTSHVGAALEGTVTDSSGAVISGAMVTLRDTQTDLSRTAVTDERGFFHAQGLVVDC